MKQHYLHAYQSKHFLSHLVQEDLPTIFKHCRSALRLKRLYLHVSRCKPLLSLLVEEDLQNNL